MINKRQKTGVKSITIIVLSRAMLPLLTNDPPDINAAYQTLISLSWSTPGQLLNGFRIKTWLFGQSLAPALCTVKSLEVFNWSRNLYFNLLPNFYIELQPVVGIKF